MQDKLAVLCELQLNAILHEAEVAFSKIVKAATTSLQLSNEMTMAGTTQMPDAGRQLELNHTRMAALGSEMQKLMVSLQFHDEFTQRISHVIELCRLLRDQQGMPGALRDEELLKRVSDIFSVGAEFNVLQDLFPEYRHEVSDSSIELF